jgi:TolB-like protein
MVVTEFRELERIGPYGGFARGLDAEIFGMLQRAPETWAVRDPGGGTIPDTELRAVRLEGSVDFLNRNLLVTARLVDPGTGGTVWERRYSESRIPDRFQYQVELGREIARDVLRQVRERGR